MSSQSFPKFLAFFVLAALGVGGSFWLLQKNAPQKTEPASVVSAVAAPIPPTTPQTPDSDSDGLKDWEEALWKTDSHSSDTDGDGMPDGDEIKAGRNPLAKDATAPQTKEVAADSLFNAPTSLTAQIAKNFGALYFQGKQKGESVDAIQNAVLSSVDSALTTNLTFADTVSEKNIATETDRSPAALRAYASAVSVILREAFTLKKITRNELELFGEVANVYDLSGSTEGFVVFETYADAYKTSADRLRKLPVPESYAPYHLALINSFLNLSRINTALSAFVTDPAATISALLQYETESSRANRALDLIYSALNPTP